MTCFFLGYSTFTYRILTRKSSWIPWVIDDPSHFFLRGAPANPLWLQICKNTLNAPLLRVPEFPPEEYIRIMKNLNKVGSSFYFYGFQGKLRAVNLGLPFEIIPWETFMINIPPWPPKGSCQPGKECPWPLAPCLSFFFFGAAFVALKLVRLQPDALLRHAKWWNCIWRSWRCQFSPLFVYLPIHTRNRRH